LHHASLQKQAELEQLLKQQQQQYDSEKERDEHFSQQRPANLGDPVAAAAAAAAAAESIADTGGATSRPVRPVSAPAQAASLNPFVAAPTGYRGRRVGYKYCSGYKVLGIIST
jgi:hypothetical protein